MSWFFCTIFCIPFYWNKCIKKVWECDPYMVTGGGEEPVGFLKFLEFVTQAKINSAFTCLHSRFVSRQRRSFLTPNPTGADLYISSTGYEYHLWPSGRYIVMAGRGRAVGAALPWERLCNIIITYLYIFLNIKIYKNMYKYTYLYK